MLFFLLCAWSVKADIIVTVPHEMAIIKVLDKISTRTTTLELKTNESATFQNLTITVKATLATPEDEIHKETLVYLIIEEMKVDQSIEKVYEGWMFGSSPSLAAMEHAVFDVWVESATKPLKNVDLSTLDIPSSPSNKISFKTFEQVEKEYFVPVEDRVDNAFDIDRDLLNSIDQDIVDNDHAFEEDETAILDRNDDDASTATDIGADPQLSIDPIPTEPSNNAGSDFGFDDEDEGLGDIH